MTTSDLKEAIARVRRRAEPHASQAADVLNVEDVVVVSRSDLTRILGAAERSSTAWELADERFAEIQRAQGIIDTMKSEREAILTAPNASAMEWNVWLSEHPNVAPEFAAVAIASAIDRARNDALEEAIARVQKWVTLEPSMKQAIVNDILALKEPT